MKVDIHNHLNSGGANPGFDETIDLVHARLGDNSAFGIANSDDWRYEQFVEQEGDYQRDSLDDGRAIYIPAKRMFVIKCQEMFTDEGHILAIATPYAKNVKTKNAKEAMFKAKDLGGLLDAVHPFYYQGIGRFLQKNMALLGLFSLWELYNGSAEFSFPPILPKDSNDKARNFYCDSILNSAILDIGVSSATDGHAVEVIGKCYSDIPFLYPTLRDGFVECLDKASREMKSPTKLHMEPNKKDAAIHTFKMGMVKLGLRKD